MRPARFSLALAVLLLVLLALEGSSASRPRQLAAGTWSVVAVDPGTREVGVALATCVPADASIVASTLPGADGESVRVYKVGGNVAGGARLELAHLVTGAGAVVAQGLVDAGNARRLAVASAHLMAEGSAEAAIEAATADDQRSKERQYGVVSLRPSAASFTGSSANEWAGSASIDVVTAQGNLLVGAQVVEAAFSTFQQVNAPEVGSLADALMAALEAGSRQGGDRRCSPKQTALTAFLAVARPDDRGDTPHIWLAAPAQSPGGDNPVALLREAYDELADAPEAARSAEDRGWQVWWTLAIIGPIALVLVLTAAWVVLRRAGNVSRE